MANTKRTAKGTRSKAKTETKPNNKGLIAGIGLVTLGVIAGGLYFAQMAETGEPVVIESILPPDTPELETESGGSDAQNQGNVPSDASSNNTSPSTSQLS